MVRTPRLTWDPWSDPGLAAIGLKYGGTDSASSAQVTRRVRELADRFRAQHKSINCPELTGVDVSNPEVLKKLSADLTKPENLKAATEVLGGRDIKQVFDSIDGVQTAEILGARQFALRAWLDANKMAAHGITAADVSAALSANNFLAALGVSKGQMVTVPLTAASSCSRNESMTIDWSDLP